jgi:hypothetical protein
VVVSPARKHLPTQANASSGSTRPAKVNIIAGSDRYETAIRVSQRAFPGASALVITEGRTPTPSPPRPWPTLMGAPFLTPRSGLTPAVANECNAFTLRTYSRRNRASCNGR